MIILYLQAVEFYYRLMKNSDLSLNLKQKILSVTMLEVKKLKVSTLETYARNLRFATKVILLCGKKTKTVDVDKFLHTLLHTHGALLEHVGWKEEFLLVYRLQNIMKHMPIMD